MRSDSRRSTGRGSSPSHSAALRTLQARVARGEVSVIHVPDEYNAADFLTKWVPATKLKESVAYTSNAAAKKGGQER